MGVTYLGTSGLNKIAREITSSKNLEVSLVHAVKKIKKLALQQEKHQANFFKKSITSQSLLGGATLTWPFSGECTFGGYDTWVGSRIQDLAKFKPSTVFDCARFLVMYRVPNVRLAFKEKMCPEGDTLYASFVTLDKYTETLADLEHRMYTLLQAFRPMKDHRPDEKSSMQVYDSWVPVPWRYCSDDSNHSSLYRYPSVAGRLAKRKDTIFYAVNHVLDQVPEGGKLKSEVHSWL